jgi:hypothetical protein
MIFTKPSNTFYMAFKKVSEGFVAKIAKGCVTSLRLVCDMCVTTLNDYNSLNIKIIRKAYV